VDFVINNQQVIITSADEDVVPDFKVSKRLTVVAGEVNA
jgi:hypothetical protein